MSQKNGTLSGLLELDIAIHILKNLTQFLRQVCWQLVIHEIFHIESAVLIASSIVEVRVTGKVLLI